MLMFVCLVCLNLIVRGFPVVKNFTKKCFFSSRIELKIWKIELFVVCLVSCFGFKLYFKSNRSSKKFIRWVQSWIQNWTREKKYAIYVPKYVRCKRKLLKIGKSFRKNVNIFRFKIMFHMTAFQQHRFRPVFIITLAFRTPTFLSFFQKVSLKSW